jgi:hypothetical protein
VNIYIWLCVTGLEGCKHTHTYISTDTYTHDQLRTGIALAVSPILRPAHAVVLLQLFGGARAGVRAVILQLPVQLPCRQQKCV